jgi:hypothetical protein
MLHLDRIAAQEHQTVEHLGKIGAGLLHWARLASCIHAFVAQIRFWLSARSRAAAQERPDAGPAEKSHPRELPPCKTGD